MKENLYADLIATLMTKVITAHNLQQWIPASIAGCFFAQTQLVPGKSKGGKREFSEGFFLIERAGVCHSLKGAGVCHSCYSMLD